MCKLDIRPGAYLFGAAMLLLLPVQWVAAMVLAAAVHECFHALAVHLLGGRILSLTIRPAGAVMESTPMDGWRAPVCALAGPLGSFALLLFARRLPRTALCSFLQGCYNLLPLLPLDGGNALSSVLALVFPERSQAIVSSVQRIVGLLLLSLALWAAIRTGIWALFALVSLTVLRSKTPYSFSRIRRTKNIGLRSCFWEK